MLSFCLQGASFDGEQIYTVENYVANCSSIQKSQVNETELFVLEANGFNVVFSTM